MTPLEKYQSDLKTGHIIEDIAQSNAVDVLDELYKELVDYRPPSIFERWLTKHHRIKGLYLWGGVGRGKTYLMDMFYESLPFTEKLRVHYHRFMLDIHEQLRVLPKSPDPLKIIGKKIAGQTRLLCIDEFHVTDVADAMLLSGLLQALFNHHVVIVATSNTAIEQLYLHGLQRERFMQAIHLLSQHLNELHLQAALDFRLEHLESGKTYLLSKEMNSEQSIRNKFEAMAATHIEYNQSIEISGRSVDTIACADDIIWFDFAALCKTARSAQDYLELASEFHTVFVSDIPAMSEAQDSEAKRFMHLIDALYDHRVKLVATAEVEPNELYSGRKLHGAFDRTVSRLIEMGSHDYMSEAHR